MEAASANTLALKELLRDRTANPSLMANSPISHTASPTQSVLSSEYHSQPMQYLAAPTSIGRLITQILLTNSDPETVLPEIGDLLKEVLQVNGYLIATVVNHQLLLETAYFGNQKYANFGHKKHPLLHELQLEAVFKTSEPVEIAPIQAAKIWQQLVWHEELLPTGTILGISTQSQNQKNGIILLMRSHPYAWSNEEKEMLKVVAEQTAVAISQVQLQRQLRTAALYKNVINQLTLAIRGAWELNQILQIAIDSTSQALQVNRGLILLLKYADPLIKNLSLKKLPTTKATVVSEWLDLEPPGKQQLNEVEHQPEREAANKINSPKFMPNSLLNQSFLLSECYLCQQAFVNAPQPLAIANINDYCLTYPNSSKDSVLHDDALPAIVMLPLENQGTILGFLVFQHHQSRSWQPEELELMNWVGAQVSTAIIQNQTLRQVQALVEERTMQLQRSLEVQAKLYEKTRQQIDQLRKLNQLKDEFVATVSHELRTPLTIMKVAICNLRRQPEPSLDARTKYLEILEQKCIQEINLIQDLLDLQKLESHQQPIQLQKIDLKSVINNLAQAFAENWVDKGLTLELELPERSLTLQTDPISIERILLELLTNAGKYSVADSIVRLKVTEVEHQIHLTLTNIGSSISSAELQLMFDKFRRGEGVTKQAIQGTGLGLALVKSLVQHLNGTISAASRAIDNSQSAEISFTITLPQFFDNTKV